MGLILRPKLILWRLGAIEGLSICISGTVSARGLNFFMVVNYR